MLKNMKIGMRLGFGFAILVAIMASIGLLSIKRIGELHDGMETVVSDRMPNVNAANDWIDAVNAGARILRNAVLQTEIAQVEKEAGRIEGEREKIEKAYKYLEENIKSKEGIAVLAEAHELRKPVRDLQDQIFSYAKANNDQAAIAILFGEYRELQAKYFDALAKMIKFQNNLAEQDGKNTAQLAESTIQILGFALGFAALFAILVAWFITRSITGPINQCMEVANKVAAGDTNVIITVDSKDETGLLLAMLKRMVDAIKLMGTDASMLVKAAIDGKLATRADATKHQGDFKAIVAGVNETLDAVIGPLNVAAKYVDEISKGNIPAKITDNYNGDFNTIKNNLNQCVEAVNNLVTDAGMLVKAAIDGRLATRADASKHTGDFRKIVQGVNDTLDAVITPVNEAAATLEKVAARDMTARMVGNYNGDLAKIKNSLNLAVENLDKALGQVTDATGQVASASQQISAGSQSLAQGANEQASSLEEVSSSLEEMASMTKQNSDNAIQAKGLAADANDSAKVGTEAMNRMSSAINRIKESSDQTAKIVKTIDEIAMQTNLLALNAAVEAARAGEAGRGFAVVAEEVRNLAQRSAQAAKNTADMIGESVKNADDGVKIAVEVSKSFEMIATGAKKVNDLIGEIAVASKEQSTGIEQVTTAVSQMDKVTQQNAANSEESASAAEELSSQAEELQAMVGQFKINGVSQGNRPVVVANHNKKLGGPSLPPPKTQFRPSKRAIAPEEVIPLDDENLKEF